MLLHSALLKNSFLEKEPAEGEQKAVAFLQGHKRIVSFFQKKLGYVLVLSSWPACSLPSSRGSTLYTFGRCSPSAASAFIPEVMRVRGAARVGRDSSRFKLLLTNHLRTYFLSLQVAVHG